MATQDTRNPLGFHALPNSPHLTRNACGYTLLTLTGLSEGITADQVERITINMVEQKFRSMSDRAVMIWPDFNQEAQTVKVYCKEEAESPRPFKAVQATVPTPDLSMGFTAPSLPYRRGL